MNTYLNFIMFKYIKTIISALQYDYFLHVTQNVFNLFTRVCTAALASTVLKKHFSIDVEDP